MMIVPIVTVLKKLAAICWRVLNGDKYRIFLLPLVTPVSTGYATAGKRKIRICKPGNNSCSVLDVLILEWEKPPPWVHSS